MSTSANMLWRLDDYHLSEKVSIVAQHPDHFPDWVLDAPLTRINKELQKLEQESKEALSLAQLRLLFVLTGRKEAENMSYKVRQNCGLESKDVAYMLEFKNPEGKEGHPVPLGRYELLARYTILGEISQGY